MTPQQTNEPTKISLNWAEYLSLCDQLAVQIQNEKFTDIIAIARGGLMPAQYIAYKNDIRRIHSFGMSSYEAFQRFEGVVYQDVNTRFTSDHKILIVDDIADSGTSLHECKAHCLDACHGAPIIKTAVLHYKEEKSKIIPDYYTKKIFNDEWIIYPYDA